MKSESKIAVLFKKSKSFIWSRAFLVNFSALIIFYILLYFILQGCLESRTNHGDKVEVPNLIGKNQNTLKSFLASSDLEFEVLDSIYEPTKIEGTILEQDPSPTSETDVFVKKGRTIKVRVSKRTQLVEMPKLVDKSQRFAENILRNRKFRYRIEYKPSREAHGAVLEQLYRGKAIAPGKKIPIGSTIKLIVGRNEEGIPLELPNLYGLTMEEARDRVNGMLNMEFLPICPDCSTKSDSLLARVQSQSPEYFDGAMVASGGSITVFCTIGLDEPE